MPRGLVSDSGLGQGLSSAIQSLGSDMVRLRSCPNVRPKLCPNVRPDTEVMNSQKVLILPYPYHVNRL
jgi:hypothetical protein